MRSSGNRSTAAVVGARVGAVAFGLSLLACSQGADSGEEAEAGVQHEAITRVDYQDGTGKILIRVKTCDYTASATENCAYCTVDDGWARIGGGAEVSGENAPGASLRASYPSQFAFTTLNANGCSGEAGPNDTNATWVARSAGPSHQLRAYVVGIRLRNTPASTPFKPFVSQGIDRVTSSVAPPAAFSVDATEGVFAESINRNGLWLIGGGAQLQQGSGGTWGDAYLTASYPLKASDNYSNVWRASARFQQTYTPSISLKVYAIGIEMCPAGWNDCFHHPWVRSTVAGSTSGYATVTDMTGTSVGWGSWLSTGPGGRAQYGATGFGRYLTDLIPLNGASKGFTARSKSSNSGTAASGVTNGASLMLGAGSGYHLRNAIRFNDAGTSLHRPSGSAPVNLRQSTASPNDAAHRFHLEPFGSGQYRLRNGNPDNGSECAYRQSGTSNVLVGACSTSTAFLWTLVNVNGLKLRNVSASQCLDNNGAGYTNSNLVLKPCASGYSPPQTVFLDAYSWPPQ